MSQHPDQNTGTLAQSLMRQAQELVEAAAGQPDPKIKLAYFAAADSAMKAAEIARHNDETAEARVEVGDNIFNLPHEYGRFLWAIADRENRVQVEMLLLLRGIKRELEGRA